MSDTKSDIKNFLTNLLNTLILTTEQQNIQVNISVDDLLDLYNKQNGICVYSKYKMTYIVELDPEYSHNISIDRIDSDKPYEINNIILICEGFNIAKNSMTKDELIDICVDTIINNLGEYSVEERQRLLKHCLELEANDTT